MKKKACKYRDLAGTGNCPRDKDDICVGYYITDAACNLLPNKGKYSRVAPKTEKRVVAGWVNIGWTLDLKAAGRYPETNYHTRVYNTRLGASRERLINEQTVRATLTFTVKAEKDRR